jgi:hypothetical protein
MVQPTLRVTGVRPAGDADLVTELAQLMQDHRRAPFPDSITKGLSYGEIDPVMIGSDVYGWALAVTKGRPLDVVQRGRLQAAHDGLLRSMNELPESARPYYAGVARLAEATLSSEGSAP